MKDSSKQRDWEEDLSKVVGDPLAFQIGYRVRQFKDQTRHIKQDGEQMLSEYLRYELDLLPSKTEFDSFCQDVQQLEQQLAELESRLKSY